MLTPHYFAARLQGMASSLAELQEEARECKKINPEELDQLRRAQVTVQETADTFSETASHFAHKT